MLPLVIMLAASGPLLVEPQVPLDVRINPMKVSTRGLPPLPASLSPPPPPIHTLASSPEQASMNAAQWRAAIGSLAHGAGFLADGQHPDGLWKSGQASPTDRPDTATDVDLATSALAARALLLAPDVCRHEDAANRSVTALLAARRPDGSFDSGPLANYVTASVTTTLASTNHPRVRMAMDGGIRWLTMAQWDQGEGLSPRADWFGGAGYGKHGRPDLSNTQLMLDALYESGLPHNDPAFGRAVLFLTRTQNLSSTNDATWATEDGGFVYTCAGGGESMASEYAGEGRKGSGASLRSYGSMTYAGFKSLLYAGLTANDPRVQAALGWISRHWTFDENPGLGPQGHFYYLHAMARAMRASGLNNIVDADGASHNWRNELVDTIVSLQRDDGSWVNDEPRWMEDDPILVTAYSMLALQEALKPCPPSGEP